MFCCSWQECHGPNLNPQNWIELADKFLDSIVLRCWVPHQPHGFMLSLPNCVNKIKQFWLILAAYEHNLMKKSTLIFERLYYKIIKHELFYKTLNSIIATLVSSVSSVALPIKILIIFSSGSLRCSNFSAANLMTQHSETLTPTMNSFIALLLRAVANRDKERWLLAQGMTSWPGCFSTCNTHSHKLYMYACKNVT